MVTIIKKWGNSLALRIPSALAKDLQLSQGSVVEVTVVKVRMPIKPRKQFKISLSQMLNGITQNNRHSEHAW